MRAIAKGNEPACLAEHRATEHSFYQNYQGKDVLRAALVAEQRGLCCYCTSRIYADRQECQVYIRDTQNIPDGYRQGWNARYTTDLTEPVWFYLRGEEYSAQLDHFVRCIEEMGASANVNSFEEAMMTDRVIAMMIADAGKPSLTSGINLPHAPKKKTGLFFGAR